MGVLRPDLMMKCIVPVVMAGIIAVRQALPTLQPYVTEMMLSYRSTVSSFRF